MGFGEKELSDANRITKIVKKFMNENNLEIIGQPKSQMSSEYTYHCFKIGVKFKGDASNLVNRFHRVSDDGIILVSRSKTIDDNQKYMTLVLDTHAESQEDHPDFE